MFVSSAWKLSDPKISLVSATPAWVAHLLTIHQRNQHLFHFLKSLCLFASFRYLQAAFSVLEAMSRWRREALIVVKKWPHGSNRTASLPCGGRRRHQANNPILEGCECCVLPLWLLETPDDPLAGPHLSGEESRNNRSLLFLECILRSCKQCNDGQVSVHSIFIH